MLVHYLKVALRGLRRGKGFAFLNVAGLALGVACCALIGLHVQDELRFDRFHVDAERIYRVAQTTPDGGTPLTGPGFALLLPGDFPAIETVARVVKADALVGRADGATDRRFQETGVLFADPAFLGVFTFPLVRGDAKTALAEPFSLLLTETAARRYFGAAEAVGGTLVFNNRADQPYRVTGVLADPPAESHLQFGLVSNWASLAAAWNFPEAINSFYWPFGSTYVRLREGADAAALDASLPAFARRHREPDVAAQFTPHLEPLTEIRLNAAYEEGTGTLPAVRIFGAIALTVLALACVNFMNLATARGGQRAREVGIRKSFGARRGQVAAQFLGESLVTSALALGVGVGLAALALPLFNDVAGKTLTLGSGRPAFWFGLVALVGAAGLVAGGYPALVLSRFRPARVLAGGGSAVGGGGLRRALVVFQFAVSIALLAGTAVAYRQIAFLRGANLGFASEQVVAVKADGLFETSSGGAARYDVFKARLAASPRVAAVAASDGRPGVDGEAGGYLYEKDGQPAAAEGTQEMDLDFVDYGFFDLLGLGFVAGRAPSPAFASDAGRAEGVQYGEMNTARYTDRALVLNEAAARTLGWTPDEALGRHVRYFIRENGVVYQDYAGAVVGVVRDFHAGPLREPIAPRAYTPAAMPAGPPELVAQGFAGGYRGVGTVLVKLRAGDARAALGDIERAWDAAVPERPFAATFLDADLGALYDREVRQGRIVGAFAALAVVIACLGLFGLAAFAAERRRKEIGVRRVLGASAASIVALLSREFVRLVLVAFALATPLAYLGVRRWLDDFAYRVPLGPGLFFGAGALALAVALVTVAGHALRAAHADPVRALRSE